MKSKMLAFILSMILLLGILTGCTPKTQETTENYTVPDLETASDSLPGDETDPSDSQPAAPEQETDLPKTDPSESENGPVTPESESVDAAEPLPTEPSSEELPTETDAQMEDPDEGGMEIESGYTVVIDDDLGIGGN